MKKKRKLRTSQLRIRDFFNNVKEIIREIPNQTENVVNECWDFSQNRHNNFWHLHKLALECLDSLDKNVLQKGKEILLKMLEIVPNHKITLYNLACAESLLGNVKEAIATLEQAVITGYNDVYHMLNDKDFNNIKNTEGFKLIVQKLQGIIPGQTEEKVEEKVEERTVIDKLDILGEIYPLPRDILLELLTQCDDSVEKVVDLINSSTFK